MLSLPPASKIYICHQPQDMRKSFDGLAAATVNLLGQTPTSGHYFVFIGRRRKLIKILNWEGDGYAIWSKRLEQGQFNLPKSAKEKSTFALRDLHMLLDGIKPAGFFKRYSLDATKKT